MTAGLQPSYWQQVAAGLAVIVPTLLVGGILLGWFTESVLRPRAAGRRWPEGARFVRPFVELLVDLQSRPAHPSAERRGWLQPVRFGLVVATCAVVPVSTGLVLTRPGLGLYVLAAALAFDALVDHLGGRVGDDGSSPEPGGVDPATWSRVGLAVVVGLMAGVVHAQWGTGDVGAVVTAQADAAVGGIDIWGLPTMVVHPVACAVAVVALHATVVAMAGSTAARDGGPVGVFARLVNDAWVVAIAAWLVVAFAGGGAVPWTIDNPGTRHVVAVVLFATKTTVAALGLAWARATWPTVQARTVRALLGLGALVGVFGIVGTLLVRHLA